jgi:hypothetical protein
MHQLPTHPVTKKSKQSDYNNLDSAQASIDNFFGETATTQTTPYNAIPARIDDNEDEYNIQSEGKYTDLPEDFL